MVRRFRPRLSYADVVSSLCLFILLGGVGYAATSLPADSVGPRQLERNAVTSSKIRPGGVGGSDIRDGAVARDDLHEELRAELGTPGPRGLPGPRGAQGPRGLTGPRGPAGPSGTATLPAWTNVPSAAFHGGFYNFDAASNPAGYYRFAGREINLRGIVATINDPPCSNGRIDADTVIFRLPVGFRPARYQHLLGYGIGAPAYVLVVPGGEVLLRRDSSCVASLDGLSFRID